MLILNKVVKAQQKKVNSYLWKGDYKGKFLCHIQLNHLFDYYP